MAASRSTSYQPKVAAKVCAALAEGRSLRDVCSDPGMPSREAVRQWHARHEDFRRQYDAARLLAADLIADDIAETLDSLPDLVRQASADGLNENAVVNAIRAQVDGKKWLLSKIAPQRYGDRLSTEITGAAGSPLIPPEAVDPRKLALALHAILAGARDERRLVDAEPLGGRRGVEIEGSATPVAADPTPAIPAPAAPPAPEPRRVFDASNGRLVRTLLSEGDDPGGLAAHAMRAADSQERQERSNVVRYRRAPRS
jgi:hypothetical protein